MRGLFERDPRRRSWSRYLAAIVLLALLGLGTAACTDLTGVEPSSSDTAASEVTETSADGYADTEASTTTEAPATTTTEAPNPVSQESRDYAESLGGTSHEGEKLYFIIGASLRSEAQAKTQLGPAKAVGDTQMYFIVQLSDNFEGMTPGYWVIFEAYDGYPATEDIEWCRRAFPDAYVKSAIVRTDDPIPVRPGG